MGKQEQEVEADSRGCNCRSSKEADNRNDGLLKDHSYSVDHVSNAPSPNC
jgi:hypothetical protein